MLGAAASWSVLWSGRVLELARPCRCRSSRSSSLDRPAVGGDTVNAALFRPCAGEIRIWCCAELHPLLSWTRGQRPREPIGVLMVA